MIQIRLITFIPYNGFIASSDTLVDNILALLTRAENDSQHLVRWLDIILISSFLDRLTMSKAVANMITITKTAIILNGII